MNLVFLQFWLILIDYFYFPAHTFWRGLIILIAKHNSSMTTHFGKASGVEAGNPREGGPSSGYSAVAGGHRGGGMDLNVELQAVGEDRSESSIAVSAAGPSEVTAGESEIHHASQAAFVMGKAG